MRRLLEPRTLVLLSLRSCPLRVWGGELDGSACCQRSAQGWAAADPSPPQVGIALHYCTLCALLWIAVTARNIYKQVAKKAPPCPGADRPPYARQPLLRYPGAHVSPTPPRAPGAQSCTCGGGVGRGAHRKTRARGRGSRGWGIPGVSGPAVGWGPGSGPRVWGPARLSRAAELHALGARGADCSGEWGGAGRVFSGLGYARVSELRLLLVSWGNRGSAVARVAVSRRWALGPLSGAHGGLDRGPAPARRQVSFSGGRPWGAQVVPGGEAAAMGMWAPRPWGRALSGSELEGLCTRTPGARQTCWEAGNTGPVLSAAPR